MTFNPTAITTLFLLPTLLAAGCLHPRVPEAPIDVEEVVLSEGGQSGQAEQWWTAFESPQLNNAVSIALSDNFDVDAAYARLAAAEAAVRGARSPLMPSVSGYATSSFGTDDPFGGLQRVPVEVGFDASYELDLWGRIRAEARGEAQRREATRAQAEVAALSVSAQVASTYINIAATQEQLALLDQQISANEQMAAIVRSRMMNGVVRQADSLRQDRLVQATLTEQVSRREELAVLEHRLAVLLGRPPRGRPTELPTALPTVPPLPSTGLASELLRRRPDVRAAEFTLAAANEDLAVAITNQYPRFTIRAGLSNAPASPEALLTGWVASLGASLITPIFEGGERRAEVVRRRALLEAQVASYGAVLVDALREVEDALVRNQRQEEAMALLDKQVDLADRTAEGLQLQYVGGLEVGYLDVLTAQTTAQQLRRQQITARQRLLTLRIELYRALAGHVPRPSEEDAVD